MKRRAIWTLFAGLLAATALQAQETQTMEIRLDPASTTIHWTLNSLLHKARGSFTLKGGDLAINPKTGLAQGEILVDATSGTSGDAARDAKWQKEILDSTTYPGILFHPNKIEGLKVVDGMQQVQASGALTLRGQDHPVELTLSVQVNGEDVVVTTHFMVPYVQWGLKQATSGIIRYDKQIAIDMTAKGELETGKGSPAGRPAPDSQ